ncbi:hypothetical protein [Paenibacillus sp. CF384]|uniref:hypothetical protein n=1 Tax=Paenibacillus sp. CF384 TaxID=1884382 RepID=UPI00089C50C4|nr:hypothetical protein [Paenibacillus sp. CF384]SDX04718.1 hypothetical protein SAMN05518855_100847 [Paenibacillus sp. CF384]
MKFSRFVLLLIVLLTLGAITYFTYPLKIQYILPTTDNIQNIQVIHITGGQFLEYEFKNKQEFMNHQNELVNILDAASFRRRVTHFQGATGDAIMIIFMYKDKDGNNRNYMVDYRESGTFMVENKDYQQYGKSKLTFDNLVAWLQKEGSLLKD